MRKVATVNNSKGAELMTDLTIHNARLKPQV